MLWNENPWSGLGLSTVAVTSLLMLVHLSRRGMVAWGAYRQVSAELFGFIGEKLNALEDLKANGAANYCTP